VRTITTGLWGLVLLSLVVGVAILIAPSAGAVQAGLDCEQGVRDGQNCLIEVGLATPRQVCPVSPTVFEDGDDCFLLQAPVNECPEGTIAAGDDCRLPVDLVTDDTECPDTFANLDGTCIRFDDSEIQLQCPEGSLVDSMCEILGASAVPTSQTCVVSGDVILEGDDCFRLVPQTQACPAGSMVDVDGLCRQPVDLVPGPSVCEDGFTYLEGSCVRFSSPTAEGECDEGVLQGGVLCVAEGTFVPGPPICPVSEEIILDGDECFSFVDQAPLACPAGTVLDTNAIDCREQAELTPSDFVCADGFEIINDSFCVRTVDPFVIEFCAEGELLAEGGRCIVQGGNPTPGTPFCPVSETVFLDAEGCYSLVPALFCPAGSSAGPDGTSCRETVALVDGPLECPVDLQLNGSQCYQVVPAVFRCDGLDVTINMALGDPGIGTEGDDVILGSTGSDVIDGMGGNDVICARGGDDTINGGDGDDVIYGQGGADRIAGDVGGDMIFGGGGDDVLAGGDGDDVIYGQGGNDQADGDGGDDTILGGTGDDEASGGDGNDELRGGADSDILFGDAGNDDVRGGAGNDVLFGGAGDDELRGGQDDDLVQGGDGNDRLIGNAGIDICVASAGADDVITRSCESERA